MHRSLAALIAIPLILAAGVLAPALVRAGGGCHAGGDGSAYMEGDGTTVIRMDTCSFAPTVSRVAAGTTVRFLNTATVQHQVLGRSGTWGSVLLAPGQEHAETFAAAGLYPYACPLHPGMVGAIVVGDGASDEAQLAASTQPADPARPTTDAAPVVIVGLAALIAGVGLGVGAARMRARTTD